MTDYAKTYPSKIRAFDNTEITYGRRRWTWFWKCAFLWHYLMFFDGVFCILSTKEVTRSGLILHNCITLFLFVFSALFFPVVSRLTDKRGCPNVWWPFFWLKLLVFDGVFCIFSTREVTWCYLKPLYSSMLGFILFWRFPFCLLVVESASQVMLCLIFSEAK